MEAIAALHAQLQAVTSEIDKAEAQIRFQEAQKRKILESDEKIRRQVRDEAKKLKELTQREEQLKHELEGQQGKMRALRQDYSSALFSMHQLPDAFDKVTSSWLTTTGKLCAQVSHLTTATAIQDMGSMADDIAELVPKNEDLLEKLIRVRSQKRKAAAKEFDYLNAQLRGAEHEKTRLEKKLAELQAEGGGVGQKNNWPPSTQGQLLSSNNNGSNHNGSNVNNSNFNGSSASTSHNGNHSTHESLQPSAYTREANLSYPLNPLPLATHTQMTPPVSRTECSSDIPRGPFTHQTYTTTKKVVEEEITIFQPPAYVNHNHNPEPWYREHRKRRHSEQTQSQTLRANQGGQVHQLEQIENGEGDNEDDGVDIYSIC